MLLRFMMQAGLAAFGVVGSFVAVGANNFGRPMPPGKKWFFNST